LYILGTKLSQSQMKTPRLSASEAEDSEGKGDTFKSVVIIYMYMCGYVYTCLYLHDVIFL
jgi:hypothetical protein